MVEVIYARYSPPTWFARQGKTQIWLSSYEAKRLAADLNQAVAEAADHQAWRSVKMRGGMRVVIHVKPAEAEI